MHVSTSDGLLSNIDEYRQNSNTIRMILTKSRGLIQVN